MNASYFQQRYDHFALRAFIELFRRPAEWTHRITETVEVDDSSVRRSVTLNITIPADSRAIAKAKPSEDRTVLVPILRPKRGELLDNLDVTDASGASLTVLAQEENKLLASSMLGIEFNRAIADAPTLDIEQSATLLGAIVALPFLEPGRSSATYWEIFEAVPSQDEGTSNDLLSVLRNDQALRQMAEFFSRGFLTSVEVIARPLAKRLIKYSYDSRYDAVMTSRSDRLRSLIGQRPYNFRFTVPLAFQAPSYHFRMLAPRGHYCYRQSFMDAPSSDAHSGAADYLVLKDWHAPITVQYLGHDIAGTPYSHLYAHGLHLHSPFPLFARVVFYERPIGSTGIAWTFSLVLTLLLVALAIVFPRMISLGTVAVDVPALILLLPGTAALWLRPTFDSVDLLRAPLASRLGLLITGVLSYLGAIHLVISQFYMPASVRTTAAFHCALQVIAGLSAITTLVLTHRLVRAIRSAPGVAGSSAT